MPTDTARQLEAAVEVWLNSGPWNDPRYTWEHATSDYPPELPIPNHVAYGQHAREHLHAAGVTSPTMIFHTEHEMPHADITPTLRTLVEKIIHRTIEYETTVKGQSPVTVPRFWWWRAWRHGEDDGEPYPVLRVVMAVVTVPEADRLPELVAVPDPGGESA